MIYTIEYEHLADELVKNERTEWHFDQVKKYANELKLELTDEEFRGLFALQKQDRDIDWIMSQMSHSSTFTEALISYIGCLR
ncbi:hypothetical protein [Paenibacillus xylanexedens]|uniref:hypothetical protein n=1 Tax=Paenibacillus xylanexedens TaxID=528191 RepID=UPI0011A63FBE|nr:hypothetical protein [Paenibacillus xylanexedens]